MKTLILLSVLFLTGCASQCTHSCVMGWGPGSPSFNAYAKHYDTLDPCQMVGKPENHVMPSFCFSNAGKRVQYIRDKNNKIIYTVK
jgi:hypothetical protein